ncbi:MAG: cytochrome c3 family protein [Candidatus Electryonea clarkiae]|nr:cytochrome c3 family protein [Candidatus Electryonea clarkiae]MDP8287414.1 cytochrome c3 family protein [Candidatus Electryonea clarkiae]
MFFRLSFVLLTAMLLLFMWGCEGEQGPAGERGEQGDTGEQGPGAPVYNYLGGEGESCLHCHSENVTQWEASHHADAYETLVDAFSDSNPYCLQCHTTGWDSPIADGDTVITEYGPDTTGFDDYWMVDTPEAMERMADLKNVQCESCHGPLGGEFNENHAEVEFATGDNVEVCANCHHQGDEWANSGHNVVGNPDNDVTTIEEFRDEHYAGGDCGPCHTSENLIMVTDEDYAGWEPDEYNMIGCIACHDPHGGENHYLRTTADVDVLYDAEVESDNGTMTGYNGGQICAQCHQGRRTTEDVVDQIDNGNSRFGPHHSPQADMFIGIGSYEIPSDTVNNVVYTYNRSSTHQGLDDGCVSCHMTTIPRSDGVDPFYGHDFAANIRGCTTCHPSATEFTDIDLGSGGMTGIDTKMATLLALIGVDEGDLGDTTATTRAQREAGYAYMFVLEDQSHGAHNPEYAKSLLDNAIDYLTVMNAENAKGDLANK